MKPYKSNDIDSWESVKALPEPLLDHPTMADLFAYLLEVAGHRAIDPDATTAYGYAAGPNPFCGTASTHRSMCPSCVALRLYRHGTVDGGSIV